MAFERAASWGDAQFDARAAQDEEEVRRGFWAKVKRVGVRLPFAEDLLAAMLPFDAIPDMLPVLGYTDDAAVLATAVRLVATHLRPEHRAAARAALARGLR